MAERVLQIPLSELAVVRLLCDCGAITEVPTEALGRLEGKECGFCSRRFSGSGVVGRPGLLLALQKAIQDITKPPDPLATSIGFKIGFALRLDPPNQQ
jgi:hypothetical protein